MNRRKVLIGGAFLIASPAIVRATSIMSVRLYDPLVIGIQYQSWPWGEARPGYSIAGSATIADRVPKPLSEFLEDSRKSFLWDNLVFRPIYPPAA